MFDHAIKKYRKRIEGLEAEITRLEQRFQQRLDTTEARLDPLERALQSSQYFENGGHSLQSRTLDILAKIHPYSVNGFGKIRIGSPNDGGYICIDDFSPITKCISCGIGDNDDFDLDLAERGIKVLQFDHTVDAAPSRHENLTFYKERIAAKPEDGARTLSSLAQLPNGGEPSILLKMDIEGDEWPVFQTMPEKDLARFRQIVVEFHELQYIRNAATAEKINRVFEKLSRSFFVCHVHANNAGGIELLGGVAVPHILELTFANRHIYERIDTKELFPTVIDAPNIASKADYRLGTFWF